MGNTTTPTCQARRFNKDKTGTRSAGRRTTQRTAPPLLPRQTRQSPPGLASRRKWQPSTRAQRPSPSPGAPWPSQLTSAKGLTQAQLAAKCNMQAKLLQEYEAGKAVPDQKVLSKLARALGVKLSAPKRTANAA